MKKRSKKKVLWSIGVIAGVLIIGTPVSRKMLLSLPGNVLEAVAGTEEIISDTEDLEKEDSFSEEADLSKEGQIGKPSDTNIFQESGADDSTDNTYEFYTIMGKTTVTVSDMVSLFNGRNVEYPSSVLEAGGAAAIEDFCTIIQEEAEAEGVRAEVVFVQSMLETGWLQYGGDSCAEQFNFSGLGTTGDGVPGNSFSDVRTGIRAQVQHLKAYACSEDLNRECVDERFDYVARESAPYVEWLGIQENPYGGGWAAGEGYGYKLRALLAELKGEEYVCPSLTEENN